MFERFTDSARRTVVLAQEEARGLDHPEIGTEHLLLGLIAQREQDGAPPLVGRGLTEARAAVQRLVPASPRADSSHVPFSKRAKKALENALREANASQQAFIAPGHILAALLDDVESVACQVLSELDVDLEELRGRALASVLTEPETGGGDRSPVVEPAPRLRDLERQVTRLAAQVAELQKRLDGPS
jgi:ATP-dependent Clp protease ATP-binding subunit ClpC